jgi:hypothetical protein
LTTATNNVTENILRHIDASDNATQKSFEETIEAINSHKATTNNVTENILRHIDASKNATLAGLRNQQQQILNLTNVVKDNEETRKADIQNLTLIVSRIFDTSELSKALQEVQILKDKLEVAENEVKSKQAQPNFPPPMDNNLELNWWALYHNCTVVYHKSGLVGQQCLYGPWSFYLITKMVKFQALIAFVSLSNWFFYLVYKAYWDANNRWQPPVVRKPPPKKAMANKSETTTESPIKLSVNARQAFLERVASRLFWDRLAEVDRSVKRMHGKVPPAILRIETVYRDILNEIRFNKDISCEKLNCLQSLMDMQGSWLGNIGHYFSHALPLYEECCRLRVEFLNSPVFSNVTQTLQTKYMNLQADLKQQLKKEEEAFKEQMKKDEESKNKRHRLLSSIEGRVQKSAQNASNTPAPVVTLVSQEVKDQCVGADAAALEGAATKLKSTPNVESTPKVENTAKASSKYAGFSNCGMLGVVIVICFHAGLIVFAVLSRKPVHDECALNTTFSDTGACAPPAGQCLGCIAADEAAWVDSDAAALILAIFTILCSGASPHIA